MLLLANDSGIDSRKKVKNSQGIGIAIFLESFGIGIDTVLARPPGRRFIPPHPIEFRYKLSSIREMDFA